MMTVIDRARRWLRLLEETWWLNKQKNLKWPLSSDTINPVFIVSSGRSGTTLLRKKIINSNEIHIPPESDDLIPYCAYRFIRFNSQGWEFLVRDIIETFENARCFKYWHLDLTTLHKLLVAFPTEHRSFANIINQIYTLHGAVLKPSVKLWGDKTPYLIYRLKWIRAIFPNARYLHLVRDGRAAVHSMVKKRDYDLRAASIRWRDSIRLFDDHRMHIHENQTLEIKYEALVTCPLDTLRNVFRFLEIPFSESLLVDQNQSLGDDVLPHHDNLGKPITDEFIDLWKHELSNDQIEQVNRLLGTELKSRNYSV